MKKLILLPLIGLIAIIPGDSVGYPPGRGGARPAPAFHPGVVHSPSFSVGRAAAARPSGRAFVPHATPGIGARPSVGRSAVVNRPVVGGGYRSGIANRPAYVSRGIYVNRGNNLYRPGYARNYSRYANWHHGYWNGWYTRPWLWAGGGLGAGWLLSAGNAAYWNPYYSAPIGVASIFDYSQPIAVGDPLLVDQGVDDGSGAPIDDSADPNIVAATQLLDQAREAFKASDYDKAQSFIDKAVASSPKDPTIHEFRALVLFARQKYPEATATIYDVLAVAPGWDWTTLQSLYADTKVYEQQLRNLEAFAKANPKDAESRFLLAYHYLIIEDRNAAMRMLKSVIVLQPKDQLAAHLLSMLEGPGGASTPPTSGAS